MTPEAAAPLPIAPYTPMRDDRFNGHWMLRSAQPRVPERRVGGTAGARLTAYRLLLRAPLITSERVRRIGRESLRQRVATDIALVSPPALSQIVTGLPVGGNPPDARRLSAPTPAPQAYLP